MASIRVLKERISVAAIFRNDGSLIALQVNLLTLFKNFTASLAQELLLFSL